MRLHSYEWSLYDYETGNPEITKYTLYINPPKRQSLGLSLTALTKEELQALRDFLNRAIDLAEPNCEKLDRLAQEAKDRGDDSWTRIFRRVPQFVTRQRRKPPYDPSVQGGRNRVLALEGIDSVHENDVGVLGKGVLEPSPDRVGTEDDASEGIGAADLGPTPGNP